MKNFCLGMLFAFGLVACAAAKFNYNYYGLQAASYDGKLLAVNPKDDVDFSVCAPDEHVKGKCVLMLAQPFYAMKADFLDTKNKLIECQKQH